MYTYIYPAHSHISAPVAKYQLTVTYTLQYSFLQLLTLVYNTYVDSLGILCAFKCAYVQPYACMYKGLLDM